MPIYEFRCTACGHEFHETVGYGKTAPCPDCGNAKTNRKLSLFSTPSTTDPQRGDDGGSGEINIEMIDCVVENNGKAGLKIGKGVRVRSRGGRFSNNGTAGVENEGTFDGPDTKFD